MKLEDIRAHWQADAIIDKTDISGELIKISRLHSKYFNILSSERKRSKSLDIQYNKLKKIKRHYYLGRYSRKTLEELGWDPIDKEINPSDLPDYLKGDSDLCKIEEQVAIQDIKVEFLKDILKAVHTRGFNLKALIDWEKFCNGIG